VGALNKPIAKRIATLFRLLGSNFEGEVLNVVAAMERLLAAEGLAFHDIATVIENANGEIEQLKYSDSDAEVIFNRGVEKGRTESCARVLSTDYFDEDGEPRWLEMANYCQTNPAKTRLKPNEQEFIDEMPAKLRWRAPSSNQGGFMLSIFWKLRGSLR
jgi:hypothetical protein